ncbi:MAG: DUF3413 domain-containing protein [Puniceicoccales bacterium]|nr:DUF3413 domain-containing protein [Puniceicoccales bacterium]
MLPVLVINLDRSPERLAKIGARLAELGVAWERLPAVDGREFANGTLPENYSPALNRARYHRELNAGEIACFLSFRKAWRTILEKKWDGAVVLEDDAVLSDDFPAALAALSANIGKWNAVKLCAPNTRLFRSQVPLAAGGVAGDAGGGDTFGGGSGTPPRFRLVSPFKIPNLNPAQAFTTGAARALLDATEKFGAPADVEIRNYWRTGVYFNVLVPPPVAGCDDATSDIERVEPRAGEKFKKRGFSKIKNKLLFALNTFAISFCRDYAARALSPFFLFCLANGVLWALLGLRGVAGGAWSSDLRGAIFAITADIGHYGIVALALLVLLAPFVVLSRRAGAVAGVVLSSLLTLFLVADGFVFDQFKQHINLSYVQMFLSPDGRDIFVFPPVFWVLSAVGVALIIGVEIGMFLVSGKFTIRQPSWLRRVRIATTGGVLLCVLVFESLHAWAAFVAYPPVLVRAEAFPAFYPLTAKRFMRSLGFKQANLQKVPDSSGTLNYPLEKITPPPVAESAPPPDILFVLVDAWRADALAPEVMPRLSKRAAAGAVRFENHVSGGNATRCGLFSLFYAIPATYWNSFFSANRRPVFMETLDALNYEFAIFASAGLLNPEFDRTVFAGIPNLRIRTEGETVFERDARAQEEFLRFLDARNAKTPSQSNAGSAGGTGGASAKPFFGFLFYDVLHSFALARDAERKFLPTVEGENGVNYMALSNRTDPLPYINLYKNSVFHLDKQLETLFAALEKRGVLQNTIIVVTGDHGQEINDTRTNTWGHNSNFSSHQTHVPLLVFWKGKPPAVLRHRTTHFDIVPTLLGEALGVATPPVAYSSGRSLFDPAPRPFTILASYSKTALLYEGAVAGAESIPAGHVLVLNKYGFGEPRTFDYRATGAKPPPHVLREAWTEMSRFFAK